MARPREYDVPNVAKDTGLYNPGAELAAAQAVTAPQPFDAAAFLAKYSDGAAAAEAARQSVLSQGGTKANAASSARYTAQGYDYFKQMEDELDKAEAAAAAAAAAKAKAAQDALAKAKADADAAAGANNARALAAAQAALAAAQAAANAAISLATTTAATAAQNTAATAAATAAAEAEKVAAQRESIGKIVSDRFAQYGLASLGVKVLELARKGYTESTITLELQNTDEYKTRFAANAERVKKNLTVLSPAEYLSVEDGYRQTLRAYGLTQFDNDAYVLQFIANDIAPSELFNRVVTWVQRVQDADPLIA